MVGHVGDGNFHSIILYDPEDKEKQKKIRLYSDNLINKALELRRNYNRRAWNWSTKETLSPKRAP